MQKLYSVSQLAEDLQVTPRALRFYEDKGLIRPDRVGSRRVYSHRDRGRVALILRGKRLGFSIREIAEWLDLYDSDPDQVAQTRVLLERVHRRVAELKQQKSDLDETLKELKAIEDQARRHLGGSGPQESRGDAPKGLVPAPLMES